MSFHSVYSPGQHCIAARGDTVYLVWRDDRSDSHIYFARSNDAGQHFLSNVRVDNTPPGCTGIMPSMALDDSGTIHVCWLNYNSGNCAFVYCAKSDNGGQSFLTPVRACDSFAETQYAYPSLAVSRSGKHVYVARSEHSGHPDSAYRVLLSRSTDGGTTFLAPDTRVFPESATGLVRQTIAVYEDTIVLIAAEGGMEAQNGISIYFARSTNGGVFFASSMRLSDTAGDRQHVSPSICADCAGEVFVAYVGVPPSGLGLATSLDTGRTFGPERAVPLPYQNGVSSLSLFAAPGGQLFLSWYYRDDLTGHNKVGFAFSTDGGASFSPMTRPSDAPDSTDEWSSTVTANAEGRAFAAWSDNRVRPLTMYEDIYLATGTLDAVEEPSADPIAGLFLQASPTGSGCPVTVWYCLPGPGLVRLSVLDETGRQVALLRSEREPRGVQVVVWNRLMRSGRIAGSGVYFVRLETAYGSLSRKSSGDALPNLAGSGRVESSSVGW